MIGMTVPAYMIPYGLSTLFFGLLADRLGRRRIMYISMSAFILLTAFTATATSTSQLILWRLLTGLGAGGVVPLALSLMGDLFPYEERGRPLGWLFGAMAGGMAFGSTLGVILAPFTGWRMLFVGVAAASVIVSIMLLRYAEFLSPRAQAPSLTLTGVFQGYRSLIANARGARTYIYVLLNSLFHSGVYTWLGVYFVRRYHLGEVGIGLALLGYGVPGFILGPVIGRWADRWGRRWLIPLGLAIAALSAALLIDHLPVLVAGLAVTLLSLGYDMTQPLLGGIITQLGGKRAGQAMGLNVFTLFVGFGLGSMLFGAAIPLGFRTALALFAAVQMISVVFALFLFRAERTQHSGPAASNSATR